MAKFSIVNFPSNKDKAGKTEARAINFNPKNPVHQWLKSETLTLTKKVVPTEYRS